MANFPKIILKKGKEVPVLRKHHWVFSGAIKKKLGSPKDGDVVEVYSVQQDYLATGHYKEGTISVRLFSFDKIIPDVEFWKTKITGAYQLRKKLGLVNSEATNAFRLIHGEGDGLPGLVIDLSLIHI